MMINQIQPHKPCYHRASIGLEKQNCDTTDSNNTDQKFKHFKPKDVTLSRTPPHTSSNHNPIPSNSDKQLLKAIKIIQSAWRGHHYRTRFIPKTKHLTVESAREGLLIRARSCIKKFHWTNPFPIKLSNVPGITFYFGNRNWNSPVQDENPKTTNVRIKPNSAVEIEPIIRDWPWLEKAIFNRSKKKLTDHEQTHLTFNSPKAFDLTPHTYSLIYNHHLPDSYQPSLHEKLTNSSELYLNCWEFVGLMLYLEGIVPKNLIKKSNPIDILTAAKLNKGDKLQEGDILIVYSKETDEPAHACIYLDHNLNNEYQVIDLDAENNNCCVKEGWLNYKYLNNQTCYLRYVKLSDLLSIDSSTLIAIKKDGLGLHTFANQIAISAISEAVILSLTYLFYRFVDNPIEIKSLLTIDSLIIHQITIAVVILLPIIMREI